LAALDHPGIVRMLDWGVRGEITKYPEEKTFHVNYVIMELAENGEFFEFVYIGGLSERIT